MDWIDLAQHRDKWQAIVKHSNKRLGFLEGPCSME